MSCEQGRQHPSAERRNSRRQINAFHEKCRKQEDHQLEEPCSRRRSEENRSFPLDGAKKTYHQIELRATPTTEVRSAKSTRIRSLLQDAGKSSPDVVVEVTVLFEPASVVVVVAADKVWTQPSTAFPSQTRSGSRRGASFQTYQSDCPKCRSWQTPLCWHQHRLAS